jgi:hypothetical protein
MMIPRGRSKETAFVLVAVLVVISILSYSAYEFAHWIEVETETAMVQGRQTQTRYLAESGQAFIEAIERLRRQGQQVPLLDNNSDLFDGIAISLEAKEAGDESAATAEPEGRMTIRASIPSSESSKGSGPTSSTENVQFGTESEAARIHVNVWFLRDAKSLESALLALPAATKERVAAVLDWLDADDVKREGGAEREEYEKLEPAIVPRNGLLESLDELLLVQGMTPAVFFGEDANRNGLLDPEENDGEQQSPMDDEDGELDPGWKDFLTLWSVEPNVDRKGLPKIRLHEPDLGKLYSQIEREFSTEWAQWIISARVLGTAGMFREPVSPEVVPPEMGPFRFGSTLDLVDARVVGIYQGKTVDKESPLRSSEGDFREQLEKVMDRLTVEWEPQVQGRLDVTSARMESLSLLKSLSEEERKKIVDSRPPIGVPRNSSAETSANDDRQPRGTNAWLLTGGILPKETLRFIERDICSTSHVIRFETAGRMLGQRQGHRLEIVLDTGVMPPRVRSRSRLDRWGSVNSLQQEDESGQAKELPTLGEEALAPGSS